MLTRHRFDFEAYGADVLVLDLERLRTEPFVQEALAVASSITGWTG